LGKGKFSKEKSVERLVSLAGTFHKKVNMAIKEEGGK